VGRPLDLLLQSDDIGLVDSLHQIVDQLREELADATLSVTEGRVTLGPRVLALRSAPIVSGGAPRGAVMVLQDITAAVIAEQIKSDFIAVASHELRTPLTSLKGHLDLLFLLDTSNLTGEQRTSITTVRRQTNNLIQLVNDLLEMARIEQGRLIAEREWINPFYMLGEVVLELEPGARARGIQLDWQVGKGLPPLWIDRLHLRRIVINLITNAVKYSHDNSLVSVRAYELDDPALLPSRPADPHWHHHDQRSIVIEVEDQGVGIRAEDQASIFTRFFRSPNPRSTEAGGTGLGLTITQALVMLHGGQIGFRSTEGVGSCFWVRLPVVNLAPVDGLSWNMPHARASVEQR
jgi:two-component system phosphate regulon sensor histidine kinase PhoR/two-component system sensor histidine kinase VicK